MSEEIFHKIIDNTATETERLEFFQLLENNPEKRDEFYRFKNLYVVSSLKTDQYKKTQEENFSKFWSKVQPNRPQKMIGQWMKYAAIFALASSLGFVTNSLLKNPKNQVAKNHIEYRSEKGSVSTIKLDDGSTIWLSSGTNLVIDLNKKGETVAALNGEAYFDLIPNPARKFVVDLGKFQIRDIGTTFNVRAYESEQAISTTLIKGQIDLIKDSEKSFLTVKPGEHVEYNKTSKEIAINQRDPSIVTAWKDGKFVFIDQPLSEICTDLENWYNVEIQIEDPKLASTRYTSVVKRSTTIEMVLRILSVTDRIHYEITNKNEGKDFIRIRK